MRKMNGANLNHQHSNDEDTVLALPTGMPAALITGLQVGMPVAHVPALQVGLPAAQRPLIPWLLAKHPLDCPPQNNELFV